MAARLRCPLCGADIDFVAWRASASCQACGRRVRFEEALAAGATTVPPAPSLPLQTEPPSTIASTTMPSEAIVPPPPSTLALHVVRVVPAPDVGRTVFGKPLGWTRAWVVVLAVWAIAGAGLALSRADMGHLTVLSARETAAVRDVRDG